MELTFGYREMLEFQGLNDDYAEMIVLLFFKTKTINRNNQKYHTENIQEPLLHWKILKK